MSNEYFLKPETRSWYIVADAPELRRLTLYLKERKIKYYVEAWSLINDVEFHIIFDAPSDQIEKIKMDIHRDVFIFFGTEE